MHVDRPRVGLLALALLLPGCPGDKGDLGSLIEDADRRSAVVAGSRDEAVPTNVKVNVYRKREGLHIDMPYLAGGRDLAGIDPDDVAEQLGVEISRQDLGDGEQHVVFDKAEVWLLDGTIYRVRAQLAHPMDIPTALGVSGFPLSLGTPIDGALVVRWNRAWGARRIELTRSEEDRRLFTHIDVWHRLPNERR